jgi:hypothetical protein
MKASLVKLQLLLGPRQVRHFVAGNAPGFATDSAYSFQALTWLQATGKRGVRGVVAGVVEFYRFGRRVAAGRGSWVGSRAGGLGPRWGRSRRGPRRWAGRRCRRRCG